MESKFNRRFLDKIEATDNGWVYKSIEAFERKGDEVCYISEYGLQELEEQDHELTDAEVIEKGIGESYNSILKQCQENFDEIAEANEYDDPITVEDLVQDVFNTVDWQYVSTLLDEMTR